MDFRKDFLPTISFECETNFSGSDFLPAGVLIPPSFLPSPPLSLLACVHSPVRPGWSVSFSPSGCYLLLYTVSGKGFLKRNREEFLLSPGTVCFFKTDLPFSLSARDIPWEHRVLILDGPSAAYYCRMFETDNGTCISDSKKRTVFSTARQSSFSLCFSDFHLSLKSALNNPLRQSVALTELLTVLLLELAEHQTGQGPAVYPYLLTIRQNFHDFCSAPYTLDGLEKVYGISKFRIVREFTAAFGSSPVAYLNSCRLETAARLLLETDRRIGEIGSMVGFDNTNHFIRLFSRRYHATPGAWRRAQKAVTTASHSPFQPENRLQ